MLNLSGDEKAGLAKIKEALRGTDALTTAVHSAQTLWTEERLADWQERHPDADEGVARERLTRAVRDKRLLGDFGITLENGETVTVGDLLDDPKRYHGLRCADPLEPGYRDDSRIAWINLINAGRPYIFSHAHGGNRYSLHRALRTLQLIGGELHNRVQQVLELMRLDGTVFDRGGELVRVNNAGQVFPVTPEWLGIHLNSLIHFERNEVRSKEWKRVDCPMDLGKRIIAMRGLYKLPRLRAVLTAPILTLDGRVLDRDGHDLVTGLLLILNNHEETQIPRNPTVDQFREAIDNLWYPFRSFPFVGPIDRGVMVAAILTAVLRSVLPTAPGFLFTAPTAGSGKSLLAICLAILVGADPPTLMPPTLKEEELRKRLLAASREGRKALVLDNVSGHLDSASLCAFLTAREYGDRVLGSSITVSVPVTTLFLVTGNNVAVAGDLNRRLLTCRIDPKTDKPYRRAFDLDPAQYVLEHRQTLVRHALTLIQGFRSTEQKMTADRTASYEDWSDTVRQTVLWIGQQDWLDVADPCDAIDTSYEEDPETCKLAGLLECWHERYGDIPKTVAEVIADAKSGYGEQELSDSGQARLQAQIIDIAGERGYVNSRRLGSWIRRMVGRRFSGLHFERGKMYQGSQRWLVVGNPGEFGG